MRTSERAFTLLEVLGAVALLGLVYVSLSRAAIEALRAEGESRRRLEASLLADERLAELETALAAGGTPPLGRTRESVEEFTVEVDVRAFEPPPTPSPADAAKRPNAFLPPDDATSFFGPPPSGMTPALKAVDVVVRWGEGDDAREVRRSTWALDTSAAQALFAIESQAAADRAASELSSERERRRKRKPDEAVEPPPFGDFEPPEPEDLPPAFDEEGEP
jgi:type II secretory pathway pseudopilin PulG